LDNFRTEEIAPPPTRSVWIRFLLETLQTVILAVVLYFIIDSVVARVRVENISMEPTLQPEEFVLVNKVVYKFGEVRHGDIIVFHFPQNQAEDYIKRIIGVSGDTVVIKNQHVYINNQMIEENYIAAPPDYNGQWVVPKDSLFVLGDNRNQSSDSHSWGFVPMNLVVGKAEVIYWPFNQVKSLNQPFVVKAANGNQ
jgi:signal peptidase I